MLIPLEQFICDKCSETIENIEDGVVEWHRKSEDNSPLTLNSKFRIVHHITSSPLKSNNGCAHVPSLSTSKLKDFLGENGMIYILKLIDQGIFHRSKFNEPEVADVLEYVEFVRRLTIPYYEEARLYFGHAESDVITKGLNEIRVYQPDILKSIIEKCSND